MEEIPGEKLKGTSDRTEENPALFRGSEDLSKRCIEIFSKNSPARAESMALSDLMLESSSSQYEELQSCHAALKTALDSVKKLQIAIGPSCSVHMFVETKPRVPEQIQQPTVPKQRKNVTIMSLFSPTFLYGLQEHVPGSSHLARKLTDACSQAERMASSQYFRPSPTPDIVEVPLNVHPGSGIPESLPAWFRGKRRVETWEEEKKDLPDEKIIAGDTFLIQKLDERSGNKLGLAYSSFFNALHAHARDSGIISGSMCYASWTPDWLRQSKSVVFKRGKDNSIFARFTDGVLPNVRNAKILPGRALTRAVLSEWLIREPGSRKLLLNCLRKSNIDITEDYVDAIARNRASSEPTRAIIPEKRASSELFRFGIAGLLDRSNPKSRRFLESRRQEIHGKYTIESELSPYDSNSDSESEITRTASRWVTSIEGVSIYRKCLRTLRPGEWLNDSIINGFMVMLNSDYAVVTNTFLFVILQRDGREGFDNIDKWFHTDELEKCGLVLIPMCHARHWYLVVLHKPSGKVQIFNSKYGHGDYTHLLKLFSEWASLLKKKLGLSSWPEKWLVSNEEERVPQQIGNDDCGVFVCATAYCLALRQPLLFLPKNADELRLKIKRSILAKCAKL